MSSRYDIVYECFCAYSKYHTKGVFFPGYRNEKEWFDILELTEKLYQKQTRYFQLYNEIYILDLETKKHIRQQHFERLQHLKIEFFQLNAVPKDYCFGMPETLHLIDFFENLRLQTK